MQITYRIHLSLTGKSLNIQNGSTAPNINSSQNINISVLQALYMFVSKIKSQHLCCYSLHWSGVPVLDYLLKLTLLFYSLSETFITADLFLKINFLLTRSISILTWCLILALTPLSIGLIVYCSSRPQLSRVSTKNKDLS